MSEAEYTINHAIDGWPICKDGEAIHSNKAILAELHQLQTRLKELEVINLGLTKALLEEESEKAKLVEALEEIIHPVRFMQERLEEGGRLNGMAAVQLAEDASYLRDIAIAAYLKGAES